MRRLLWLAVGLLVSGACRSVTEPFAGVRVETTVRAATSSASAMAITTTVTNASARPITFSGGLCPVRFRVETMAGVRVQLAGQTCTLEGVLVTLAPGEVHHLYEQWDGRDHAGVRVSGTYRVIGDPFGNSGPQSEPVTVQIP